MSGNTSASDVDLRDAPPPPPGGPPHDLAVRFVPQRPRTPPANPNTVAWWDQGPLGPGEDAPDPRAPGATGAYQPPDKVLTTLGWLKHVESPVFPWFEWHYLKFLHKCLTDYWWLIQGGSDERAMELWHKVFLVLELDRKAQVDIMLLAQSGLVGRSVANELMWDLMSTWALVDCYEDLSHKVSYEIKWRRRTFDRPPRGHGDLVWWRWSSYDLPRYDRWDPRSVPRVYWQLATGPGGRPLPPPACWGPE